MGVKNLLSPMVKYGVFCNSFWGIFSIHHRSVN